MTLFKLVFAHNKPIAAGDIRAASGILRRWLCEGEIGRLCRALGANPTFPVLDNSSVIAAISNVPDVRYYLTGGVKFNGSPVMHIYSSDLAASTSPSLPLGPMPRTLVKTKKFLEQKRVFFEGEFYTCEDIIRFTANKLGGVHLDFHRDERGERIQRAADYLTYGGPPDQIIRGTHGTIHLALEPQSEEALSGFHVEIIAAATSFLNIQMDGKPLVVFKSKSTLWSRVRRRLQINRKRFLKLYDVDVSESGSINPPDF